MPSTSSPRPVDRIGVVGPNGVGKSTLLRALAGLVPLERGRVERTPPTATVGYLPQEPARSDETVTVALARRTGRHDGDAPSWRRRRPRWPPAASAPTTATPTALDRWLALGGADLDARVGQVWADLGLPARLLDQPTASLSGGEAARAGLAALLLARFDVFLLDEPTNDLDLAGLDRLERWITDLPAAVVLVSHDRTFLARTVTDVVEIDEFTHRASALRRRLAGLPRRARGGPPGRLGALRGVRHQAPVPGRAGPARAGVGEPGRSRRPRSPTSGTSSSGHFKVNQTEQLAGRAARTEKAIERLETVDKPREPWQLRLTVGSPGRTGDVVARLDGVVVERGSFALGPIDLLVATGDRIALVGPTDRGRRRCSTPCSDGSRRPPGAVDSARASSSARSSRPATGLPARRSAAAGVPGRDRDGRRRRPHAAGQVRARRRPRHPRRRRRLSPGERTRASLALLMANGANVLVLDEPTNHLDLPAIEQLEAALDGVRRDGHPRHPRPLAARTGPPDPADRAGRRSARGRRGAVRSLLECGSSEAHSTRSTRRTVLEALSRRTDAAVEGSRFAGCRAMSGLRRTTAPQATQEAHHIRGRTAARSCDEHRAAGAGWPLIALR